MHPRILLFIVGLTGLLACSKNTETVALTPPAPVMQFDTCSCSGTSAKGGQGDYYLSAVIDGVPICFDAPPGLPDSFATHMRHGYIGRDTGDQYYDNVYMIKNSSDGKWQLGIFLENTHALNRQFPYTLPRVNPYYCEIGELQLISQENFAPCAECAGTNSYSYYGRFWGNEVTMTVNSFDDNVYEGVFSGTVYSKVAKPVKITDGKFHIRLIVYDQYIKL